ncbi:MAG TPA: VWA domain-containing protein [Candidatus Acidoferrum sp.]|nr:VWA domain-containing protein [Candidatus Acidoferrum sp.]
MPITRSTACLLTLAIAGAQTPQSFQDTQAPDTVIRINVNLVQTDAIVTDAKGKLVTDLKKEDFVILQDGKPQPITNFAFINAKEGAVRIAPTGKETRGMPAAPPPPPPGTLKAGQVRRTIALVVDDLGLSFESIARVRQSIKKWVDSEMQQGDLVAVIRTSAGMGALQQFTADKRILYTAIERIRYNSLGRVGVSSFAPLDGQDPETKIDTTVMDEERERVFSVGSMGAIQYVVEGLREVPGRKSVVLFSENLRMIYSDGPNQLVQDQLTRLTDAANRSSVVIYSIDPRGLVYTGLTAADNTRGKTPQQISQVGMQRSQQMFDSQTGMVLLAHNTGGLFMQNTNDIDGSLRKVVEDGDGYYLIGYHPDASTFDEKTGRAKFHNISVRVKRAGLHVRSRKGFIGTSDRQVAPIAHTRNAEIAHALFSPFSTGALHLRLTTLYSQTANDGAFINALLHFDPKELKFTDEPDDWHKAVVDTVAITFGAEGQQVDATDKQWTVRAKGATYESMLKDGIVYSLHVAVKKPGAYQMRVVLRDATSEQVGSATQFIEVPDVTKGRLTLSGIVLAAENKPQQPKAADGVGHAEGQVADADPNGTAAVRIFKAGAAIAYGYQILNAQAGDDKKPQLEVQTRLFHDGEAVYTGKPTPMTIDVPTDPKRMVGSGRLQLGKITPGDYVLQVIVTDKLAKDKYRVAAQSMDFQIQ